MKRGDKIRFYFSESEYEVTEVGIMQPQQVPVTTLRAGEVGYICASIKDVSDARVGDTIMLASEYKEALAKQSPEEKNDPSAHAIEPLPGCKYPDIFKLFIFHALFSLIILISNF